MIEESKILEKNDPLIGECIGGRFVIEQRLDEGGFGAVYLAADLQLLGRKVVIKVLLDTLVDNVEARRKFDHEKEALARLDHPVIVNILAAGTLPDDKPYLVMPYVEGRTLKSIITERGALPLSFCAKVVADLTDALSSAHSNGILHRDVKPPNIILAEHPDGSIRTRLIDFGIARVNDSKVSPVTQIEKVQGTLWYMSPEQLQGKLEQTPAVDVFSCAVVFYEMLTGRLPFDSQSVYEMYQLHQEGVKYRITELRPEVPVRVDQLILQALSSIPEERPADICEFGKSIASALLASAGKTDRELGQNLLLTVKLQDIDSSLSIKDNKFIETVSFNEIPQASNNSSSNFTQPSDKVSTDFEFDKPIKQPEKTHILPKTIGFELADNDAFLGNTPPKDSNSAEPQNNQKKLFTTRFFIWTGLGVWIFAVIIFGGVIYYLQNPPNETPKNLGLNPPLLETPNSPNPTLVAPAATDKAGEKPDLFSYYLSVQRAGNGKKQEPFRSTGEELFFQKNDEAQLVAESSLDGYLYLFIETADEKGLKLYFLPYIGKSAGVSFMEAGKEIRTEPLVSTGHGTDIFWMVWTNEKNSELEKVRNQAIKKQWVKDKNDIAELQDFLQYFADQKVEHVKDNSNQKITIKKSGEITIYSTKLEHR